MRYGNKNQHGRDGAYPVSAIFLTTLSIFLSVLPAMAQSPWSPQTGEYDNYMTISGYIMQGDQELQGTQYEVGCFIDDKCRGTIRLKFEDYLGHPYPYYLSIWGSPADNGKAIKLLLYNHQTGETLKINETPAYQYNGDLGGFGVPLKLTTGGAAGSYTVTVAGTANGNVSVSPGNPVT